MTCEGGSYSRGHEGIRGVGPFPDHIRKLPPATKREYNKTLKKERKKGVYFIILLLYNFSFTLLYEFPY